MAHGFFRIDLAEHAPYLVVQHPSLPKVATVPSAVFSHSVDLNDSIYTYLPHDHARRGYVRLGDSKEVISGLDRASCPRD